MEKLCVKCGDSNHTNKSCKGPVTSFGIIVFTDNVDAFPNGRIYPKFKNMCAQHKFYNDKTDIDTNNKKRRFILVERKDTIEYLSLIQGNYPDREPAKSLKINEYVLKLTCKERQNLVFASWHELWKTAGSERRDSQKAKVKFFLNDWKHIESLSVCRYGEADYIMPKGRLQCGETQLECAIREFSEETGYKKNCLDFSETKNFVKTENFIGSDGKSYRNVFFLAKIKENSLIDKSLETVPQQKKEVQNVGWFTLNESLTLLRDQQKKDILLQANSVLDNMLDTSKTT